MKHAVTRSSSEMKHLFLDNFVTNGFVCQFSWHYVWPAFDFQSVIYDLISQLPRNENINCKPNQFHDIMSCTDFFRQFGSRVCCQLFFFFLYKFIMRPLLTDDWPRRSSNLSCPSFPHQCVFYVKKLRVLFFWTISNTADSASVWLP